LDKQIYIPTLLASIVCSALATISSAHAADFPDMQVGTMVDASGTAVTPADATDESTTEPERVETDESSA
jgi:hypothetical protein